MVGQSMTPKALGQKVLVQECLFLEGSVSWDYMLKGDISRMHWGGMADVTRMGL